MRVIYDAIQIDPSLPQVAVCGAEWIFNAKHKALLHEPTKTVFEVFLKDEEVGSAWVRSVDFYSLLVAIADGFPLPPPEMIVTLGRQAIALYLVAQGYLKPDEQAEDFIPGELLEHAHAC